MQVLRETTAYRASLRDRIIEKAMQDFSMHGIRAVKMDTLAKELGISKRTMYEIFEDKETLLFEGIKIYGEHKREYLQNYSEVGHDVIDIIMEVYRMKLEEVRGINPNFYLDLMKYPKLLEHMKESQQKSREGFLAFMKRGVEDGYFRTDVNYELVPHIFDALGQHILSNSLVQQYSVEELFSNCFLIALRGFCTDKGLHTIEKLMAAAKSE